MSLILRQGGAILGCAIALYAVLLSVTLAFGPRSGRSDVLSTAEAGDTIFMTEPKYIYLNRTPLRDDGGKVVIVGGSNVNTGFVLPELALLGTAVHNLGLGGANVSEVRQVIDLIQEVQNPIARRREILVLGLWYGMFGENRFRWYTPDRSPGDTDIDIERYRYGFERRTGHGPVSVVPWRNIDLAVNALYPVLVLDKLGRDANAAIFGKPLKTAADLNEAIVDEDDKVRYLDYWSKVMGPTRPPRLDEQFLVLEQTCEAVLAQGSRLVLVDLPLPRWHTERSPYQGNYKASVARLAERFVSRPGFAFLDMTDLDDDRDFFDEVHPKPRVTLIWATRLAGRLSPLLRSGTSVAGSPSVPSPHEGQLR